MGAPAARVGDATIHGTLLGPGPGSVTVLIEGRPAWRASVDRHVCPLADGARPHVGGSVQTGSATVRIGGYPAARKGDVIIEAGPPNAVATGAERVLIG